MTYDQIPLSASWTGLAQIDGYSARIFDVFKTAFVRSPEEARRPQDVLALVAQKQIRGAYAEATVALAGTGKADDQALSAEASPQAAQSRWRGSCARPVAPRA